MSGFFAFHPHFHMVCPAVPPPPPYLHFYDVLVRVSSGKRCKYKGQVARDSDYRLSCNSLRQVSPGRGHPPTGGLRYRWTPGGFLSSSREYFRFRFYATNVETAAVYLRSVCFFDDPRPIHLSHRLASRANSPRLVSLSDPEVAGSGFPIVGLTPFIPAG